MDGALEMVVKVLHAVKVLHVWSYTRLSQVDPLVVDHAVSPPEPHPTLPTLIGSLSSVDSQVTS